MVASDHGTRRLRTKAWAEEAWSQATMAPGVAREFSPASGRRQPADGATEDALVAATQSNLAFGRDKPPEEPVTVSALTAEIRRTLEQGFARVWVTGELSNVARPRSGHVYLTLKDDQAQIRCVMWRPVAARLPFEPADGLEVVLGGRLTVYPPRGNYQITVEQMLPKGLGALELAFRQLRDKLHKEGLFDEQRKKPLPFLPRRIGIVTSPTGAAIHDMLRIIDRRFPRVDILLAPVRVQGQGAAEEIAEAVAELNRIGGFDVLIVGRGGGSLEDLWAFNEEVVARAIAASAIPVVSAVGHEIDVTISDLVADRRALTPSEAAELVVPQWEDVQDQLRRQAERLATALQRRADRARSRLELLASTRALRFPYERLQQRAQRLDELADRAALAAGHIWRTARQRLAGVAGMLESLSPLAVLARGYSITSGGSSPHPLRDAADVKPGDEIHTRLARGRISSTVTRTE